MVADGLLLAGGEPSPPTPSSRCRRSPGRGIAGLPADAAGFIPVNAHGRVAGAADVYAAGDATAFPVKQGGLATQQADAVAEAIAAAAGAHATPAPFRPVLRGLLLTGGAPLYLRAELSPHGRRRRAPARRRGAPRRDVHAGPVVAARRRSPGRYLAPYLATARPRALGREPLHDRTPLATAARRRRTTRSRSPC